MDSSNQPPLKYIVISALLVIILQLVVAPVITIFGVVPNFILVGVIIIAMRNAPLRATIMGFLLGLVYDLFSLGPFGVMAFVLTIIAYAVSSLNKGVFTGGTVVDLVILFLAIALGELLVSIIYAVVGVNPEFLLSLLQRVLPAIVYDMAIGGIFLLVYSATSGGGSSRKSTGVGTGRTLSRKLNK